ncbi:MAG TPA: Spy/CpxP family protein refolding chaperone [Polyangiaceae bacterium]
MLLPLAIACTHGGAAPPATAENPAPPPPPRSAMTQTPTPGPARGPMMADPARELLNAAEGLQLSDTQRATVRTLQAQLDANARNTHGAFQGLHAELAAEVRAGTVGGVALQPQESQMAEAVRAHIDREADAENALYAVLDPSQRAAVVAAVRATQPGRTEAQGPSGALPSEMTREKKLARLTDELRLDPTQQQQVSALLAPEPSMATALQDRQRRFDELLAGFTTATFDARAMVPEAQSRADMVRVGVQREVAFLNELLPVLRPDQRELLARHLETGARPESDKD